MPWQPESLSNLVKKARELINKFFNIQTIIEVYLCTEDEMSQAVLVELEMSKYSQVMIDHIKEIYLKEIIGKYFSRKNEIWLLEGKGDNLEVLVHELLHSIQRCSPNREKIVDYLTYKLTGLTNQITDDILQEWKGIEKSLVFKTIVKQFLNEKDCEEFES